MKLRFYLNSILFLLICLFNLTFAQNKFSEGFFSKRFKLNWIESSYSISQHPINNKNEDLLDFLNEEFLYNSTTSEIGLTMEKPPNIITALGFFDKFIVGINYSTLTGKNAFNTKGLIGYFGGLSLSARTAKAAEFMFEMAYSGEGTKQETLFETKSYRLHNLQIGFLYKYGFFSEGINILPNLLTGIFLTLTYGENGELIIESPTENGNIINRKFEEKGASTWDAVVGFGLDLISSKNNTISKKFGIELRYKFGLETIASDDATPPIGIKKEEIIIRGSTLSLNFIVYLRDPLL